MAEDWHDLGAVEELSGRPLQQLMIGRTAIALSHVGGELAAISGGFHFPRFPFIAHSRGGSAEDMENNVGHVRGSLELAAASRALAGRAVDDAPHAPRARRRRAGAARRSQGLGSRRSPAGGARMTP
jgi:hypothetical protein